VAVEAAAAAAEEDVGEVDREGVEGDGAVGEDFKSLRE
jgi:hypothetical protein